MNHQHIVHLAATEDALVKALVICPEGARMQVAKSLLCVLDEYLAEVAALAGERPSVRRDVRPEERN